ncbi:MAG: DUF892 family protein [Candidatus Methylacidiphilales bacterium]|nr:DUF892 family protein [Candidatus Methylacidiphilales bacterium]
MSPINTVNTIEELYIEQLKDLYSAEIQLVNALHEMACAATHPRLKEGFTHHMEETRVHVERLEEILASHHTKGNGRTCRPIECIINGSRELISEEAPHEVKDAGLLMSAQLAESYEIAGYGCVQSYARMLGDRKGMELLQKTLDEESVTNARFLNDSHEMYESN